jgi:putative oxidoreductase
LSDQLLFRQATRRTAPLTDLKDITMSTGLLILRIVIGLLLAAHGAQKLFGWFGGYGIAGTGGWLESIGFKPGKAMAVVTGLAELAGGLALAVGLLTPLAAAVVVGTMTVAAWSHAAAGLWATNGGYELPLIIGTVGAALAFTGAGDFSLDNALGLTFGTGYGVAAIALGLVAAGVNILRAKSVVRASASADEAVAVGV